MATKKKKQNTCPWCDGLIGKDYTDAKRKSLLISEYDKAAYEKLEGKELSTDALKMLIAMSFGIPAYTCHGHPWLKSGAVISDTWIRELEMREYIERHFQHFDNEKPGLRWDITKKGEEFIKKNMEQI